MCAGLNLGGDWKGNVPCHGGTMGAARAGGARWRKGESGEKGREEGEGERTHVEVAKRGKEGEGRHVEVHLYDTGEPARCQKGMGNWLGGAVGGTPRD